MKKLVRVIVVGSIMILANGFNWSPWPTRKIFHGGIPPEVVFVRGTKKYDDLNRAWQLRGPRPNPLAIALPRHESDVTATVRWAAGLGLRVVARGGGLSFEKYSYGDRRTLVLDMRRLDQVTLGKNSAVVGAGLLVGPLSYKLWADGKVLVPTGYCPTVGMGSALGGGLGNFGSAYGLSLDNILEMNVVTAKGHLLKINKRSHGDLFWAMLGGGPSFGIVTQFVFRTFPAPSTVFVGILQYDIDMLATVAVFWQKFVTAQGHSPTKLSTELAIRSTYLQLVFTDISGRDEVFDSFRSKAPVPSNYSSGLYPFPDFLLYQAKTSGEIYSPSTILEVPSDLLKITRLSAQPVYAARKSFYIQRKLTLSEFQSLQALFQRMPRTYTAWIESYAGAVRGVNVNETAFVHRGDTLYNVVVTHYNPNPCKGTNHEAESCKRSNQEAERFNRKIFAFGKHVLGSRESYQNYLDGSLSDYLQRYYDRDLERLVEIKRKYDPSNVFRFPQSIPTTL